MHNPTFVTRGLVKWQISSIYLCLALFVCACVSFGYKLDAEPHFVDESAYIAQSFYADLLLDGRSNDPAWLDYAAYDLPPLPKYLIGISLRIGGFSRPASSSTTEWYSDTSRRFVSDKALTMARIPSVILAAMGCVAIYAIGSQAFGRWTGLIAALLLMLSPLYRLHARRAMSDVPAEAFMLASLALGLAAWSKWVVGKGGWKSFAEMVLGAGFCIGLAVLSKLNGTIAGMILAAWVVLGYGLSRVRLASKLNLLVATMSTGIVAFATFVALNPFLTAHPIGMLRPDRQVVAGLTFPERLKAIADHRVDVSSQAKSIFPNDALRTVFDKLKAVTVQGYGRFSPIGPIHSDSTRRFDWSQDWSAILWIPTVLTGLVVSLYCGRRQLRENGSPTAWAVALAAVVAAVAVTLFIPLAWDRYYLSLQPGAILLASAAIMAPFTRSKSLEPI